MNWRNILIKGGTFMKRHYQICTNCVMDTTDSKIVFDEKGVCDFCNDYYENIWKKLINNNKTIQVTLVSNNPAVNAGKDVTITIPALTDYAGNISVPTTQTVTVGAVTSAFDTLTV